MIEISSIHTKLHEIADEIINKQLKVGVHGHKRLEMILFLVNYSRFFRININTLLSAQVEQIFSDQSLKNNYNFHGGLAGEYSFYQFLKKCELINSKDLTFLIPSNNKMKEYSIAELNGGNTDFLYGPIGVAFHFLISNDLDKVYFNAFFNGLLKLLNSSDQNMFLHFDEELNICSKDVHIGIPHGIIGILKLCVESYKKSICIESALLIINRIVDYLKQNLENNGKYSFCSVINNEIPNRQYRLAWCYCDLGVGIILMQTGLALKNEKIKSLGYNVMKKISTIRGREDSSILDACICHGSAGAAHIFNKMQRYTNDNVFKDASEYWIKETLNFAQYEDGFCGYVLFNSDDNTYKPEIDLFCGISGIGLTLISHINRDFNWDYYIMLND